MRANMHNGGAFAHSARGTGNNTATAAGSGDATEVDGAWQSRMSANGVALSGKLIISYTATLAAGETLTFAANFQDATDSSGTGAADFGDAVAATTVATGDSGGSTETGTFEIDIDFAGAKEFIRSQVTPNLSASGTDTCAWHMDYVFFGDHRQPSTKSTVNLGSSDAI